jgi:hypothetical protein
MGEKKLVQQEAEVEIELLIAEHMRKYAEEDYSRAYTEVLKRNPELAEAYTKGETSKKAYKEQEARMDKFAAGKEVARLIDTEMLTYRIEYGAAMTRVLDNPANEELVKIYME